MKIDIQRLETCELALTIEVEAERLEAAKKATARRLAEKHAVPGFRKGKAPYQIILRHFGEQAILEKVVDELGPKIYEEALDENHIDPFAPGVLTEVSLAPVVFKFVVPLKPEVDLGAYRSLRLLYAAPEVSDEAVEEALEHLREHQAVLEPVDRPAEMGDVITVDVTGMVIDGDRTPLLLDEKGVSVLLDPEVTWPVPGFAEKLIGLSSGEERQIDLTIPDDFAGEELRGKPARFAVSASAVKSRYLPEWNDDLAQEIGDYETLLDLRAGVRKQLQENVERDYTAEYARSVADVVVAGATVRYPPILLEREIKNLEDDLDQRLREQKLNLDDFLKIEKKTRETLREELRPRAAERLRRALALGKVVDVEGLDIEAGEVEDRIETMSAYFGENSQKVNQMLSTPKSKRSIALDLLADRALVRLVAIAKGEAPAIPTPNSQIPTDPRAAEGEPSPAQADAVGATEAQPAAEAAPLPESAGAS